MRAAGGRVRVTTPGVIGDSGMGASTYPLFLRGNSRTRLHESHATYTAMRSGAPLLRGVTRPTITAGSVCMGLNLGLDLRTPLPPFPPALRNEDGVFGFVTQTCCPAAFMGHLPVAVWHLPDGDRTRSADSIVRCADGVRSDQLLLSFLRTCYPKLPSPDERRNWRVLGEGLMGLGDLSADGFRSAVRTAAWEMAATTTANLSGLLDEFGGEPEWWAADVRRLLTRYGEKATDEWYGTPSDLWRTGVEPQDALELFQEFVRNYGHLLLHWYDMADAANGLRVEH
jgi:hypothetical protein